MQQPHDPVSDDDYGDELDYNSSLEETLRTAETAPKDIPLPPTDIEDAVALSPYDQFRKRGWLSVTDLTGPIWCEMQFDYKLRTLPYLPPSKRPTTITTPRGAAIAVDQVKVQGKERIMRRGEKIHKRLEREIHPAEVTVTAETREDAWGLRLLNMLSALEALLTLGKCRELPVAGFVGDILVIGIIDEITREPLVEAGDAGSSRSTRAARQASLEDFFGGPKPRTHRLLVSDSKTRASGNLPREADTLGGKYQVMLYKEIVDSLLVPRPPVGVAGGEPSVQPEDAETRERPTVLPTSSSSGFDRVFAYLGLNPDSKFSDTFMTQSRPVIIGNDLRWGAAEATCLADFAAVWARYVERLGLGTPGRGDGLTDDDLQLVYRRAAPYRDPGKQSDRRSRKKRRKGRRGTVHKEVAQVTLEESFRTALAPPLDEESQLQLAIALSLQDSQGTKPTDAGATVADAIVVDSPEPLPPQPSDQPLESPEQGVPDVGIPESVESPRKAGSSDEAETYVTADESATLDTMLPGSTTQALPDVETRLDSQASQNCHTGGLALVDGAMLSSTHPVDMVEPQKCNATEAEDEETRPNSPLFAGVLLHNSGSLVRPASRQSDYFASGSEREREDDELAWAVEVSLGATQASKLGSAEVAVLSPEKPKERSLSPTPGTTSASIIGRTRFTHDRVALERHLHSVLGYWMGAREPRGVAPHEITRCGFCEFQEGCEWREDKAREDYERYLARKASVSK